MTFYTYQYLLDHQTQFPYLRIVVIVILATTFIHRRNVDGSNCCYSI